MIVKFIQKFSVKFELTSVISLQYLLAFFELDFYNSVTLSIKRGALRKNDMDYCRNSKNAQLVFNINPRTRRRKNWHGQLF